PVCLRGWAHAGGDARRLKPLLLIIPLYEKIRLSYLDVQAWAYRIDSLIKLIIPEPNECEWDIQLITTTQQKEEFKADVTDQEMLKSVLIRQHPRLICRLRLRIGQ